MAGRGRPKAGQRPLESTASTSRLKPLASRTRTSPRPSGPVRAAAACCGSARASRYGPGHRAALVSDLEWGTVPGWVSGLGGTFALLLTIRILVHGRGRRRSKAARLFPTLMPNTETKEMDLDSLIKEADFKRITPPLRVNFTTPPASAGPGGPTGDSSGSSRSDASAGCPHLSARGRGVRENDDVEGRTAVEGLSGARRRSAKWPADYLFKS